VRALKVRELCDFWCEKIGEERRGRWICFIYRIVHRIRLRREKKKKNLQNKNLWLQFLYQFIVCFPTHSYPTNPFHFLFLPTYPSHSVHSVKPCFFVQLAIESNKIRICCKILIISPKPDYHSKGECHNFKSHQPNNHTFLLPIYGLKSPNKQVRQRSQDEEEREKKRELKKRKR